MSKVVADISMSLDGFVTGPNPTRAHPFGGHGAEILHAWFSAHKTGEDLAILHEAVNGCGAVVMRRKSFDDVEGEGGWGDQGPLGDTPCFVVTHHAPTKPAVPIFTFVTAGVASAIARAQAVAGSKTVNLHGAKVPQQALALGLLDEIQIHLVPVLLGDGIRMFDDLGGPVPLECTRALTTPGRPTSASHQ